MQIQICPRRLSVAPTSDGPSLHFLWLFFSKSSSGDLVLLRSHFLGIQNIGELSSAQFWYIYLGTSWIRSTADGGFAIESELNFAIQVAFEVRVQRAPWLLVFAIWTNEAIQQCIGCLFSDCHVPARTWREENDICTFALVLRGSTKRGPLQNEEKAKYCWVHWGRIILEKISPRKNLKKGLNGHKENTSRMIWSFSKQKTEKQNN